MSLAMWGRVGVVVVLGAGITSLARAQETEAAFECGGTRYMLTSRIFGYLDLFYRGSDGHWHQWPMEDEPRISQNAIVRTRLIRERGTDSSTIRQCNAALGSLRDVFPGPPLLFLESDGRLPAGWVVSLWRDRNARNPSGFLYTLPGNDIAVVGDELLVLRDDRPSGGTVRPLGLSAEEAGSLSGIAGEIVQRLAAIRATRIERARARRIADGRHALELRVRDQGGQRHELVFDLAGAAPAEAGDSRAGRLVCRRGDTTLDIEVPAGQLAEVRQVAGRLGYSASDCAFSTRP